MKIGLFYRLYNNVGYTVGNFVLRQNPLSNVLFNFCTSKPLYFVQNLSFLSVANQHVDKSLATLLLTSGFRRYIAEYTVLSQILDVIQSDVALYSQVH